VIEALLVNIPPGAGGVVELSPDIMRRLRLAVDAPACERERLLRALVATDWNKTKAARHLRWSRMTLYRKIHQYDLRPRPMAAAN
jgi:transcriptional regulator of acetoin/glycerol metabolism